MVSATLLVAGCGTDDDAPPPSRSGAAKVDPKRPASGTVAALVRQIASQRAITGIDGLDSCELTIDPPVVRSADQASVDSAAAQLFCGGPEPDRIEAGDGNDIVVGGAGDDTLYASVDGDANYTANATNVLIGGDGNDTLIDAYGPGLLFGGAGNDTIQIVDPAREYVDCGDGNDVVSVLANDTSDVLENCERVERVDVDQRAVDSAIAAEAEAEALAASG